MKQYIRTPVCINWLPELFEEASRVNSRSRPFEMVQQCLAIRRLRVNELCADRLAHVDRETLTAVQTLLMLLKRNAYAPPRPLEFR